MMGLAAFGAIEGHALGETAKEIVGLDVSEEWVRTCARTLKDHGLANGRAVQGSADALPFGDGAFDVVCMVDVLHHLDRPEAALLEAHRVIRPGGRLLVFEPNKLNPLLTFLCVLDRNEWGFLRPPMGTARGLREMVERPGFTVEEIHPSGLLIGPDGPRSGLASRSLSASVRDGSSPRGISRSASPSTSR